MQACQPRRPDNPPIPLPAMVGPDGESDNGDAAWGLLVEIVRGQAYSFEKAGRAWTPLNIARLYAACYPPGLLDKLIAPIPGCRNNGHAAGWLVLWRDAPDTPAGFDQNDPSSPAAGCGPALTLSPWAAEILKVAVDEDDTENPVWTNKLSSTDDTRPHYVKANSRRGLTFEPHNARQMNNIADTAPPPLQQLIDNEDAQKAAMASKPGVTGHQQGGKLGAIGQAIYIAAATGKSIRATSHRKRKSAAEHLLKPRNITVTTRDGDQIIPTGYRHPKKKGNA